MPPLIFFALAGAGVYATYKLMDKLMRQAATPSPRERERIRRENEAVRARASTRNLGELEFDELDGVYRPRTGRKG